MSRRLAEAADDAMTAVRCDAVEMDSTVTFTDRGTSSAAFVAILRIDDGIALGFGIEANRDLDLHVSDADARRIVDGVVAALGTP